MILEARASSVILKLFLADAATNTGVASAILTMEQAGWKKTTTADSLKEAFVDTGKTSAGSLGLVLISQG